jgi:hypothetical protein
MKGDQIPAYDYDQPTSTERKEKKNYAPLAGGVD